MPTILDYAGLSVPEEIHGRSVRPLVEGRDAATVRRMHGRLLEVMAHDGDPLG
ncbi:MAG: hypothetical protein ABIK89_19230 [Planctomycetota bacterium]